MPFGAGQEAGLASGFALLSTCQYCTYFGILKHHLRNRRAMDDRHLGQVRLLSVDGETLVNQFDARSGVDRAPEVHLQRESHPKDRHFRTYSETTRCP